MDPRKRTRDWLQFEPPLLSKRYPEESGTIHDLVRKLKSPPTAPTVYIQRRSDCSEVFIMKVVDSDGKVIVEHREIEAETEVDAMEGLIRALTAIIMMEEASKKRDLVTTLTRIHYKMFVDAHDLTDWEARITEEHVDKDLGPSIVVTETKESEWEASKFLSDWMEKRLKKANHDHKNKKKHTKQESSTITVTGTNGGNSFSIRFR
ncbi:uncharacterized protein J4E79_007490 [Alternaria viburni]|uniref:uncharacterized protein n=1 Tax=Alternaria viburni TaxID=566460 RepID=UPI0020C21C6C|nr:uncharacterized protein J4E79_007490 [Alternaria viburni]KAI4657417.1 hypothetical protein J4E79_007490 [Alternaria viburni]